MKEKRPLTGIVLERMLQIINSVVLVLLVACYAATEIPPADFWPLAFITMGYPIILALTVAFTIYWILRRNWWLFLNIALLVYRWDLTQTTVQLRQGISATDSTEGIKVMTFNVRLFDYYNWSHNKETRHWTYDFLFNQQPNILCIQEFYHDNTGYFPTIDTLMIVNSIKHAHTENYVTKLNRKQLWGMATLTSYPIVEKGRINFEGTFGNLGIYTDLLIDDDTVRVYNIHLQSIRLSREGYEILDQLVEKQELENMGQGRLLAKQMINAFVKRGQQADLIAQHMAECPHPVILCGDFNDVPSSYAYQRLAKGMKDSFRESGSGYGNTYVRFPFFRIDNILHGAAYTATDHTVHPYELSDHFAVTAILHRTETEE
jgi:endonuclease/exonuclease/phosphatase family metal-dependent hydrolase